MSSLTTSDQLLPLINQVRGHLTVTHELLEAQQVQTASSQTEGQSLCSLLSKRFMCSSNCVLPEVGGNAQDDDQHGVVDVETVGNEGENAHGAHDLKDRKQPGATSGWTLWPL